jgi:hypothetical protein
LRANPSSATTTDFSGIKAPFKIETYDCPVATSSVTPGGKCNMTLSFSPTSDGSAAVVLNINQIVAGAESTPLTTSMALSGTTQTIGNSAITFTPSSIDFGPLRAYSGNALRTFTLKNDSSSKLYIKDISGFDADFIRTPDCPRYITNSDAGADAVDQAVFFLDALREGFFARAGASSAAARISIPTTCPLASKSTYYIKVFTIIVACGDHFCSRPATVRFEYATDL